MANINRIYKFVHQLADIWAQTPELRFGQLISNFISENGDIFYISDEEFIEKLKEYVKTHTYP